MTTSAVTTNLMEALDEKMKKMQENLITTVVKLEQNISNLEKPNDKKYLIFHVFIDVLVVWKPS